MPSIIMGDKIYCPLCDEPMTRREVEYQGKGATIYFCRPCEIGIYDFDPAFNKWRDTDKEIPCPNCKSPLKWFIRFMDGFFKGVCPKCGCVLKKDGDVKFGKGNEIILPDDMHEEEIEPPVQLYIPFDKLKRLGKDKINGLKNRCRKS